MNEGHLHIMLSDKGRKPMPHFQVLVSSKGSTVATETGLIYLMQMLSKPNEINRTTSSG